MRGSRCDSSGIAGGFPFAGAAFSGLGSRRRSGTETERARADIHMDVSEPGSFQARREGARVYQDQSIKKVEHAEEAPVEAVDSRKRSAGTKHPGSFSQEAVLKGWRWNVVQHGEAHDPVEGPASQRHGSGVFAEHANILTDHAADQGNRQSAANFNAGKAGDTGKEEGHGDSPAGQRFGGVDTKPNASKATR